MARKGNKKHLKNTIKQVLYGQLETHRSVHTVSNTITTTVDTSEMTDISQGDGEQNRQGNALVARSFNGRLVVKKHASATASVLRAVLYTPKNVDSLLTTLDTTSRIDKDSYNVWFDKLITVHTYKPVTRLNLSKKWTNRFIKGMNVHYASSIAGDLTENAICLALVSDEATNGPTVTGDLTLYFKDP